MEDLKRANKVTAYWKGEGIAIGAFYRTHEKLVSVQSDSEEVIAAGFVMPVGTDEAPVTAAMKLEAFKNFLSTNSTVFGIAYDPVDRRPAEDKYPSKYDTASALEYGQKILISALTDTLTSVQTNVVDKMAKAGHVAEGTQVQFAVSDGTVEVTESYSNGNIKYANITFPVIFAIGANQVVVDTKVELVSGQLKKPRQVGETVLTMTGIKGLFVEKGLLPLIEKPAKTTADAEPSTDAVEEA